MNQQEKEKVADMIGVAAEVCGFELSPQAVAVMLKRLSGHQYKQIEMALIKCMDEVSGRLTLAEIKKRIDDGRPTAELAWSQVPKSEHDSAVLTDEQNQALCAVSSMIDQGDMIPARMAFKEKYDSLVAESRAKGTPAKFVLSAGFDPCGRFDAVKNAVEAGKLPKAEAVKMLPDFDESVIDSHILQLVEKTTKELQGAA